MHMFLNGISIMWNANSHIQDLNSYLCVYLLLHEYIFIIGSEEFVCVAWKTSFTIHQKMVSEREYNP